MRLKSVSKGAGTTSQETLIDGLLDIFPGPVFCKKNYQNTGKVDINMSMGVVQLQNGTVDRTFEFAFHATTSLLLVISKEFHRLE